MKRKAFQSMQRQQRIIFMMLLLVATLGSRLYIERHVWGPSWCNFYDDVTCL